MGADIYLNSVWESWFDRRERHSEYHREHLRAAHPDATEMALAIYAEYRTSGGYFRNGYNAGDIMWAMGLSWHGTVTSMLDDKCNLPIARARELLAMIEARSLTKERLSRHFLENLTGGVETHPITGDLANMMNQAAGEERNLPPPDFQSLSNFLNERRDQFIALLRKSIELNEPLSCSL